MRKFITAASVGSVALFARGVNGDSDSEEISRAQRMAFIGVAPTDQLGDRWLVTVDDYTADSDFCTGLAETLKERCDQGPKSRRLRSGTNDHSSDFVNFVASDFDSDCIVKFQCDFESVIAQGKLDDLFDPEQLEKDNSVELDKSEDQGDDIDDDSEGNDDLEDQAHRQLSSRKKQWGLERISEHELGLSKTFSYKPEYTGKGVDVYVVDTGVNSKHIEFEGRYSFGWSAIKGESNEDEHGHGSHVAGILAGNTFGVAPEAHIIGVKVFDSDGTGPISNIVSGIKWSIKHFKKNSKKKDKSAVLNLSIQAGKSKALKTAVKSAIKAGMVVVVAAGNLSKDACSVTPAQLGGKAKSNDGVITVTASDKKDRRARYSNYGKCTDLFAPGSDIVSAWKGGAKATRKMSGTSQASPHVAGVVAQLLQKNLYSKHAAQKELFEIGVWNTISAKKKGDSDYFLQRIGATQAR